MISVLTTDAADFAPPAIFAVAVLGARLVRPRAAQFLLRAQLRELREDLAVDVARGRVLRDDQRVKELSRWIYELLADPDRVLTGDAPPVQVIDVAGAEKSSGAPALVQRPNDQLVDHWHRLVDVAARYARVALPRTAAVEASRRLGLVHQELPHAPVEAAADNPRSTTAEWLSGLPELKPAGTRESRSLRLVPPHTAAEAAEDNLRPTTAEWLAGLPEPKATSNR